eukprot:6294828-Lingulodinium_polyedra.AAC.1
MARLGACLKQAWASWWSCIGLASVLAMHWVAPLGWPLVLFWWHAVGLLGVLWAMHGKAWGMLEASLGYLV